MKKKLETIRELHEKLAALVEDDKSPLAERAKAMLAEAVQKLEQAHTAN